jgi:hypothetical protein
MYRRLRGLLIATGAAALAVVLAVPAAAATGGDSNRGDVWLTQAGRTSPGHAMEPHLSACSNIWLWGANMGDSGGSFTLNGWSPTGHKEVDYSGTWHYPGGKAAHVIAVISSATLIANARAHGDTAQANQGYHFKLMLSQDPQKHKVFWLEPCATSPSKASNAPAASVPGGSSAAVGAGGATNLAQTGEPIGLYLALFLGLILVVAGVGLTTSMRDLRR